MQASTFTKSGQLMYNRKIYVWYFNGDTEIMLVKNGGDEVLRYKIPPTQGKKEICNQGVKLHLSEHLNRPQGLTYHPFKG